MAPDGPKALGGNPVEQVMEFDLATHEARRRVVVLDAMGAHWDPDVVLANEEAARELLYSGLDGPAQQIYDHLVAAGVIPRRPSTD
jgi:microcompartment protein CcmK/EutM